ncbi:MAG: RNA-binding protein [Chthoniobacterales bacterium]
MGNKLYVANLAFHLTENEIQDIFSPFGTVQEVKLILDKMTGKSRGFAFVTMASDGEAERATAQMNGHRIEGRALAITEARPREDRPQGLGSARPPGHGGPFRPNAAPASGSSGFGANRPPFSGGGSRSAGGRDSGGRGEPPRREKEKPRGPRPMRDYDED